MEHLQLCAAVSTLSVLSMQLLEAGHDSAPRILLQHTRSPQQRTRRARPRRALVSFLVDTAQQKYIQGATVLAKSSLRHAPGYFDARLLMVLNGRVYEESVLEQARLAGWRLKWVDPVSPPHAFEVPKSRDQFVKLRLWSLTDFDQVTCIGCWARQGRWPLV